MEPFATVEQYEARFGEVADEGVLEECLADASAAIRMALPATVDPCDVGDDMADRLMRVCRSVANRIMPSGSDVPVGVTQMTETAGVYSQTMSYTPAYGLPKLLPSELAMLGVCGRVGVARPSYGRLEPCDD